MYLEVSPEEVFEGADVEYWQGIISGEQNKHEASRT